MCFSSKPKTPKVSTKIPAPEPKLEEEPKGIDFGGEKSGAENEDGDDDKTTRIEREGESSEVASALSTAKTSKPKTKYGLSGSTVRGALAKRR